MTVVTSACPINGYLLRASKTGYSQRKVTWYDTNYIEHFSSVVFYSVCTQWAFGVTCWEVFMAGKIPYPALDPTSLLKMLESAQRLEKPPNAACAAEV